MKVLLIDPPGRNKGLNVGLGYLAAVLKGAGKAVSVLDLNNIEGGDYGSPNPDLSPSELRRRIEEELQSFQPDLVGISVKTYTALRVAEIIKFLRNSHSSTTIVVGGPHISLEGMKYLQENDADIGVQGEGEETLLDLCQVLKEGSPLSKVQGIVYRQKGMILKNQRRPFISNLDCLPFPDYRDFSSVKDNLGRMEEYPLLTSRGCPFQCAFCAMGNIMGRVWRYRSPENVIAELKEAKELYGARSFQVVDDNFTLDTERAEAICDLLINEGIGMSWSSQNGLRADRLNEDLLRKMKESNCRYVWVGVESADEEVFASIKKGEKLEDIRRGILMVKDAGIEVGGFFIIGLPYSTRRSDLKSLQFVRDLGIRGWWFNFVPYPYTESWNWVQKHGRILRPIEGVLQYEGSEIEPVFETEEYSREGRIATYEEIHMKMGYFDRLFDRDRSLGWNLVRLLKRVPGYGLSTSFLFASFALLHTIRSMSKKVKDILKGQPSFKNCQSVHPSFLLF